VLGHDMSIVDAGNIVQWNALLTVSSRMKDDKKAAGLKVVLGTIMTAGIWGEATLAASQDLVVEEVVVTAQKRVESLQDTPISIVAFSADQMSNKQIFGLQDLQGNVPNLQFIPHPNSATTPRIFLRGIGSAPDITRDGAVAVYVDGVYQARSQGLSVDIAGIERIEVLRGPQGTLYGRNATGGAVNFITQPPSRETVEFEQKLSIGNRDLYRSTTSLNVPLAEGLAGRLSYMRSGQDGHVRNAGSGSSYFGSSDRTAMLADLLWSPLHNLDVRYSFDRSMIKDSPAYLAVAPAGFKLGKRPRRSSPAVEGLDDNDITVEGHALTITWLPMEHMEFKSITAYRELDSETNQGYLVGALGNFPIITSYEVNQQDQWSQEFQLLGDALDGQVDYIIGLYYFKESGDLVDQSTLSVTGEETHRLVDIRNQAYAVFSQVSWLPPMMEDKLKLTVGARWSRDQREAARWVASGPIGGTMVEMPTGGTGKMEFSNFSPSFTVAYEINDSLNLYGKVADGYKTGGFNIRAGTRQRFIDGFDEETLRSYELGMKSRWLDNRLVFNIAAFLANYEGIQLNVQVNPARPSQVEVLNAGEAEVRGVELELRAVLLPGLSVDLQYGYLDPSYRKVVDGTGASIKDDFAFVYAPRHSYTVDVNYELATFRVGTLSANFNYSWQDRQASSYTRTVNSEFLGIPAYGVANARLMLSEVQALGGEFEFALWGRNLGDEEYYLEHGNALVPFGIYGEPRTYGIDMIYRY